MLKGGITDKKPKKYNMFFYFAWLGRSVAFFLAALLTGFQHQANEPPYKITGLGKDGGRLWFNNESILIDSGRIVLVYF